MRNQKIQITFLALVAFSLLGGDVYASVFARGTGPHRRTARADKSDEQIPGVLGLDPETIIPKVVNENENKKNSTLMMMLDTQKPSKDTEIKKKPTINTDIIKQKNETKYQNIKKDKDEIIIKSTTVPLATFMTTTMEQTVTPTTMPGITEIFTEAASTESSSTEFLPIEMTSVILNNTSYSSSTTTPSEITTEDVYSPLLLDGEPIENLTTTTEESLTSQPAAEDENMSRARALNISASEPTNSLQANLTDLSDVSMDEDEDKETEGGVEYVVKQNETTTTTMLPMIFLPPAICQDANNNNKTYNIGEKIIRGCESKCVCGEGGVIKDCEPICVTPYVRAGRGNTDPFCREEIIGDDGCCAVVVCSDSAPEPDENCVFGNKTISRGQRIEEGCSRVCICEAGGLLKCQPRCPPNETVSGMNQHDRCVALSDPRDSCCTITLCDVSLGEHEIKSDNVADLTVNLTDVKVLNSTAIKLKLSSELSNGAVVEISEDNHNWNQIKPDKTGIISNLEPAHSYHVRITEGGRTGPALRVILPAEVIKTNITEKMDKASCNYRGKLYKIGAEWYDECLSFCTCQEGAKTECATIHCPLDAGLDVLDPTCLDWEYLPTDFVAKAPDCCPKEARCKNNGSCKYEGGVYENWSTIPHNVTGCETTCYCNFGNVSCQATCPPVPALPPSSLNCPANQAVLAHLPDHECCKHWICNHTTTTTGMNATTAYPGPLAPDMNIHPSTDTHDTTSSSSSSPSSLMPTQESAVNDKVMSNQHPVEVIDHSSPPYTGPYNPDYKPTESSVEEIFRLPGRQPEKMAPPLKDKSKSKIDNIKKPLEPFNKPHKEIIEQQLAPHHHNHYHHQQDADQQQEEQENEEDDKQFQSFPGPLAPNNFPTHLNGKDPETSHVPSSKYPNKYSSPSKKDKNNNQDQPQFVPFNQPDTPTFPSFSPNNGESIPPTRFDPNQFDNSDVGPPYTQSGSKKKTPAGDVYHSGDEKIKPGHQVPGKIKPNQRKPEQVQIPDDLLHIFHREHPALDHLDQPPSQGHPGLYEFHQQISNQKDIPINQIATGYFNPSQSPTKTNKQRPQIVAHENEDGETTYHIHTPDIPNSPAHLEELLAHITAVEQNSKQGPYQQYPNRPLINNNNNNNNYQNGPPPPPPRIETVNANSGDPYLNHPFAIPTPNQSGNRENFQPGFPIQGFPNQVIGQASSSDEVVIKELEALVPRNVRVVFTVPPVLIGLQARFELRYTSNQSNPDPSTWNSQLYLPPNEVISTPKMEVELDNLEIATVYKVKVIVNVQDLTSHPSSQIYTVKTYEPPKVLIDAELQVVQTNSTWVNVAWRKFENNETRFVDGVQLTYKLLNASLHARTPLIHRAITGHIIEDLKPDTVYEIGIAIIPYPGQKTELVMPRTIIVRTAVDTNPYDFEIDFEIKSVKSQEVEISWSGVPFPVERYVNIYRVICKSDRGTEDMSTFKIAKSDSPAKTTITGLKPGTRYSLWLLVYLTNGKSKESNVKDFVTKPGAILSAGIGPQGKLASVSSHHQGDYYGPLVIVAIVASLSIMSTLILLMMLMKRRSSSKADISPRKTTSAYDNPSYKVEIQQETMDL